MQSTWFKNINNRLTGFFSQAFPLLDDNASKLFLVVFSGLFASFFIYIYNPFRLMDITYDTALGRNLSVWTGGIIGSLILVVTQFFLRKLVGLTRFNVGQFILWVLFDFICVIIGIFIVFGEPQIPFFEELQVIVGYCVSLGFIPYLIACLLISVIKISRKTRKHLSADHEKCWFRDENGKIKLALKPGQILYLKSENNYTSVYYLQNQKVERTLIRNTLKKLEEQLDQPGLVRIHRSYMVNLNRIISIHPTKRGFELTMDQMPDIQLSVSGSYKDNFKSQFQNGRGSLPIHPK